MNRSTQFAVHSRASISSSGQDENWRIEAEISPWLDSPTGVALQLPDPTGIEFFVTAHRGNSVTLDPWGATSVHVEVPGWVLDPHTAGATFGTSLFAPVELWLQVGSVRRRVVVQIVPDEKDSRSHYALKLMSTTEYVLRPRNDDEKHVEVSKAGEIWVPDGALNLAR